MLHAGEVSYVNSQIRHILGTSHGSDLLSEMVFSYQLVALYKVGEVSVIVQSAALHHFNVVER